MNNRISQLLRVKDVTASRFADLIGVQPSNISHIISGRNKPSLDFVVKVVENFPDISLEWLMFGKGEMFTNDKQKGVVNISEMNSGERINEEQTNDIPAVPDLFSSIQTEIHPKIESQTQSEDNDLKHTDQNLDSIDSDKVVEEILIENDHESEKEVSIENNAEIENQNIQQQKSEEKVLQKVQKNNSKPIRIVMVYDDETFEILEMRK